MTHTLNETNTILNKFLAELRDVNIQRDSMRFRRNLERVGEVMAYEISKTLDYAAQNVETSQGEAVVAIQTDEVVIASVLRAGIPFHQGFLNYFDDAQSSFISAYRKYSKDNSFNIKIECVSCCDITDKILILVDPMLATGSSLLLAYNAIVEKGGVPKHTHLATCVASEDGLEYITKNVSSENVTVWSCAVDAELTVKSYIVPGIGDAGDLAYGVKL